MVTATRYIGTCPVCEGEQKLHKMTLVHHGYQRPVYGSIQGDCFGVGYPPYELSTEGTEAYLVAVRRGIDGNEEALARLRDPDLASIDVSRRRLSGWETTTYTPADGYQFQRALQEKIDAVEAAQRQLKTEERRCVRLIQDFTPRRVRTEEEDLVQKSQVSQARRAVLDEARSVRQAKRAALDAKQRAREQEHAALIEEYRQIFESLASQASPDARAQAKRHWVQMFKEEDVGAVAASTSGPMTCRQTRRSFGSGWPLTARAGAVA